MNTHSLISKIESLPLHLQDEVLDFVNFLHTKENQKPKRKKRQFGSGKGTFVMADDFDAPLDDFKEYMQ
ncbi:MAG: DUF2281 domain-containing protein [Bacteroidetes bacterium]|nr:MAG: DUF2281 domain-containing protein [Bacteroidota bacterium]